MNAFNNDAGIVKLIAEFLASVTESADKACSLVQLLHFVDHKNKSIPTLEEISSAISMADNIKLIERDRLIYFSRTPDVENQVETINDHNLQYAYKLYAKNLGVHTGTRDGLPAVGEISRRADAPRRGCV